MTDAFILIGPPGAGKSTYAVKLAKEQNAVIVAGDCIRDELEGAGFIYPSWVEIWDKVEEEVVEAVEQGKCVILDGTHVGSTHRVEAITLLQSYGYNAVEAIIIDTPLTECVKRNANRNRSVPEYVITHMYETLHKELHKINTEGFTKVTTHQ